MDVVVAHGDAHRVRADGHAFDQRMRVVADDVAVLERARLAFVGIADEVFLARELARHEAPLQAGRETGAAAAAQAGGLQVGDDLLGRDLLFQDAAQRRIAAALDVVGQVPVVAVQVLQDQRVDVTVVQAGHLFSSSSRASIFSSRHERAHAVVIHQHDRRVAAGAHALAFQQGELAVCGGVAAVDAQGILDALAGALAARQGARQVGADGDLVLADRLQVVHVVEGGDFLHGDGGHADVVGHFLHRFRRQPALFDLRVGQRGHHGRLALVGRVLGQLAVDFL